MGTFGGGGTAGWVLNGAGNRWKFSDKTGSPANGIVVVTLQDRTKDAPGRVRMKIKAKDGHYLLRSEDESVNATVVLGDGTAGECVETTFVAADCKFGGLDTRFRCRLP